MEAMTRLILDADSVRALRAGRTAEKRVEVRPQPPPGWAMQFPGPRSLAARLVTWEVDGFEEQRWGDPIPSPFGPPGSTCWVAETWQLSPVCPEAIVYRADDGWEDAPPEFRWKPSSRMRQEDSRLTVEVVSVRVDQVDGKWMWHTTFKVAEGDGPC